MRVTSDIILRNGNSSAANVKYGKGIGENVLYAEAQALEVFTLIVVYVSTIALEHYHGGVFNR